MTTTENTASKIHPFERAGLGLAPFRFVGMVEQDMLYGQVILNREEYERTGIACTTKPGGSCDYCGQYIVNMYRIESSDGRRFKVGCDCVAKVGDKKLERQVDVARREHDRKLRAARKARKIAETAAANTTRCAAELAVLDAIAAAAEAQVGDKRGFAYCFAADVAKRIRTGKQGPMSPRQAELARKLAAELGVAS